MSFKHKLIILSSIGFGLGVIMGTMLTAFSATMTYSDGTLYLCSPDLIKACGNPLVAFTIQALFSGIYGILAMGGSAVYSIENWGLVKCTAIHYIATMAGIFVLAFSMRWFPINDVGAIITMFIMITIPYICIWLANYLSYRAQLEKINKELEELKTAEENAAAGI